MVLEEDPQRSFSHIACEVGGGGVWEHYIIKSAEYITTLTRTNDGTTTTTTTTEDDDDEEKYISGDTKGPQEGRYGGWEVLHVGGTLMMVRDELW